MRITIPVSGDGDAWMSHLPEINFEFDRILETLVVALIESPDDVANFND